MLDHFGRIMTLIIEKQAKKLSVLYSEAQPLGHVIIQLIYSLSVVVFLL